MTTAKAIKHARKNYAQQNQNEFAESVGITQPYLSRLENGHAKPTVKLLESMADHCGVPMAVLFWFGITDRDVQENKVEAFRMLKPTIDSMMNEIFKK